METPGPAAYCGLAGKPGGERGGDRGAWGARARGGGVRGDSAAGTDGAGLGAADVEGVLGVAAGEGGNFSPRSWAAILLPATHSVSKFLARSNTTFALM